MPRISEMFAFIAEDTGPEDEGVAAVMVGNVMLPLVGADMARVASLRPVARSIASASGKTVRLVKFSLREELETLAPGGGNGHAS